MEFRSSHEKLAYLCLTVKDHKDNKGRKMESTIGACYCDFVAAYR